MKKFRKIFALLLSAALVFSLGITVMAENTGGGSGTDNVKGTKDDWGTITVNGITDTASSLSVKAYPIVLATYDETTDKFSGYDSLYNMGAEKLYILYSYNGEVVVSGTNEEETEKEASAYAEENNISLEYDMKVSYEYRYEFGETQLNAIHEKIINENGFTYHSSTDTVYGSALSSMETNDKKQYYELTKSGDTSSYTFTASNVAVGAYLIVVSGAASVEYNVGVASVYYTTANTVVDGSITMADGITGVGDGEVWMKAEEPKLDKQIAKVSGNPAATVTDGGSNGTSANVGDTISYQVTVSEIPYYGGDYPVFNLTDTLEKGLNLNYTDMGSENPDITVQVVDSLKVSDVGAEDNVIATLEKGTDYTVAVTENEDGSSTVSIDFVFKDSGTENDDGGASDSSHNDDYTYTLNKYELYHLLVTYNVTLGDDASLDSDDNSNTVVLEYSLDSSVHDDHTTLTDTTHIYSFTIDGNASGIYGEEFDDYGSEGITYPLLTKIVSDASDSDDGEDADNAVTEDDDKVDTADGGTAEGSDDADDESEIDTDDSGQEGITPLAGAEFTLYTDEDCTEIYTNGAENGEYHFDGTVVTDDNGKMNMPGLSAGTYYLKETKAPKWYTLNTTVYRIVISADYKAETGELADWSYAISARTDEGWADEITSIFTVTSVKDAGEDVTGDDTGITSVINPAYIGDTMIMKLPFTGNMSTLIFTIIGVAIIVTAACLFMVYRRRARAEK
ncbi:MAG: hypothetical protein LUC41_03600 [Clostridiales bacterium]|nr:hypothetical protein [Clostridiales bacterium]